MNTRKYHYNNSTMTIVFGNILDSKAEVIVSSDDTGISMAGGISGAIRKAGGDIIREDAQKKLPAPGWRCHCFNIWFACASEVCLPLPFIEL